MYRHQAHIVKGIIEIQCTLLLYVCARERSPMRSNTQSVAKELSVFALAFVPRLGNMAQSVLPV